MPDPVGKLPSELDQLPDRDAEETAEWAASLDAVTEHAGPHRAAYLMRRTFQHAESTGVPVPALLETDYLNTIPTAAEPAFEGDEAMESRIAGWNRWNAAAMVTRGSRLGVGGHIATFASAAWLYETGFNHFFHGKEGDGSGDQLYIQGHASPASTPARSSTAVSPRSTSTTSARRRAARDSPPTRTPGGCPGCGSSPRSPWASARSPRSTRRVSTAT